MSFQLSVLQLSGEKSGLVSALGGYRAETKSEAKLIPLTTGTDN
jgi:hypothetical protein